MNKKSRSKNNSVKPTTNTNNNSEKETILEIFKYFDPLNKGFITTEELINILKSGDNAFNDEEIKQIILKYGIDNNSKINYIEFIKFWGEQ